MKKGFDYLFENIDQLPPEIAEVVLEFKFTQGFKTLLDKYKLHYDQAETLEDMTFRVMFSDMTSNEFTAKLVTELDLAPATAKELTEDTDANIIAPVKKAIQAKINAMLEEYKDIPDDEVSIDSEEGGTPNSSQGHLLRSTYNEPIEKIADSAHPSTIGTSSMAHLTDVDILHAIENPPTSFSNTMNSPIKTVSGTKSYSEVMSGNHSVPISKIQESGVPSKIISNPATPENKTSANLPVKIADMIAIKGSSITVTSPTKIGPASTNNVGGKIQNSLTPSSQNSSVDPYREPAL